MSMKCLSNFGKFTDGALESKCHTIISSLTGNAFFPTPVPSLTVIETAADDYSTALVNAGTGNRADIAVKNACREVLTNHLVDLARYLNFIAANQPEKLLTTGFDVSKEPAPVVITRPQNLKVVQGVGTGELLVSVKAVKGAVAYLHEYSTDASLAPGSWVSAPGSSSKMLLSNLVPGTLYYCRVGAVGRNDQLLYSDVVSRIAA